MILTIILITGIVILAAVLWKYQRQMKDICRQIAFLREHDSNMLITTQIRAGGVGELAEELNELLLEMKKGAPGVPGKGGRDCPHLHGSVPRYPHASHLPGRVFSAPPGDPRPGGAGTVYPHHPGEDRQSEGDAGGAVHLHETPGRAL